MTDQTIVIVAAARTALGAFGGELASVTAPELACTAIKGLLAETGVSPDAIDSVGLGCVLTAGLRQAPARQAALHAGLPNSTPCTTVNKVCGSSLQTLIYGYYELMASPAQCVIAGGMESMSQAPYLLPKARFGKRLGHGQMIDHLFFDGLENAYGDNSLMGLYAEKLAEQQNFSRAAIDELAIESTRRALQATEKGLFQAEITPHTISTRKGDHTVDEDEGPKNAKPSKIPTLRPAFSKDGVITAGNSSSLSDGAAALMLMTEQRASELGLKPLAKILGFSSHATAPELFTTAPIGAITKLLTQLRLSTTDVDLYEINEAFAVVALAAITELALSPEQVNIYGGAVALGHPLGATGARLLVTLLNQLKQEDKTTGIATACIGGGEALAIAIERLN